MNAIAKYTYSQW